ncbi:MAG TPA: FAD-dependent oxidoreductase [Acidimicrobiales bacterium]|nr:FAD-dependent oxidoreductase [Acidimicrobiales bacterium]
MHARPLWWDRPLPKADLYVIGLGAAGLAACIEARGRGASVVGVDAGRIGGGASGRNGGFLLAGGAAFHHRGARPELYEATLTEIRYLARSLPGCVRAVGSERQWSSKDEHRDCEAHAAALREHGFSAELRGSALFLPDDASFDPLARCLAWAAHARRNGAMLVEHRPLGYDELDALPAAHVLVCIDGGIENVLPELATRVRTARLQMLATEPTREVRIPRPVYARFGFDYWQQLPDGRVVVGGCRDRHVDAEFTGDAVPTDEVQTDIERVLRDTVGVRRATVTHRWAGLSAYPRDGDRPIAGPVSSKVMVTTGYAGTGNLIGPLAARALVALALDGTPVPDWLART